jgi:hypothetical protein
MEHLLKLSLDIKSAGPDPSYSLNLPKPRTCVGDMSLPRVLFLSSVDEFYPRLIKKSGVLNREGELIRFTDNAFEATNYGNKLEHPQLPGSFVLMLFPYESTNPDLWLADVGTHHFLPGARTFVTDQSICAKEVLVAEYREVINKNRNIIADQYSSQIDTQTGPKVKQAPLPASKLNKKDIADYFNLNPDFTADFLTTINR